MGNYTEIKTIMESRKYEPELGQMCFGQPWKRYEGCNLLKAALVLISRELDRIMWNIHQKDYESPFSNTGNQFKNDTFEVQAYSWDETKEQPYNFKWDNVEVSWYKYLGRGVSCNQPLCPDQINQMLNECLESLQKMEEEDERREKLEEK